MEKQTNTFTIDGIKYTVDHFISDDKVNKWIPVDRISNIIDLDAKTLKKNIGSHLFKKIEFEGNKYNCVDAIGLLKIAHIIDSPSFYNEMSKFTIVQKSLWFKLDRASRGLKSLISLLQNNEKLDHDINLYDRIGGDLQHHIENSEFFSLNGQLEKELKLSRNLRRLAKIEKDASDLIRSKFTLEELCEICRRLDENVRINKEKLYRPRIDSTEAEAWNLKVSKHIK